MPGKSTPFTPSSILFHPHQMPLLRERNVVEVPGTAPGSDGFIAMAIYRHSHLAGGTSYIIGPRVDLKRRG
jgi:hypothetical protein